MIVIIYRISSLKSLTLTQITNAPILEHIVVTAFSCAPISISIIHCCTRLVALLFVIKRKNAKFPGGGIHFALRSLRVVISLINLFCLLSQVKNDHLRNSLVLLPARAQGGIWYQNSHALARRVYARHVDIQPAPCFVLFQSAF